MYQDHQYALDVHGNWVNAKQTKYSRLSAYFCDCPERHKLKLVKPSGKAGKRPFCDYFAHIGQYQRRKNEQDTKRQKLDHDPCIRHAGESTIHRLAKHRLREMQGFFHFVLQECYACKAALIIENCRNGKINIEVKSVDGKWRYDCVFIESNSERKVALEIVHKHATTDQKVNATREQAGWEIAEFEASEVMARLNAESDTKLKNLIVRTTLCQHCLLERALEWQKECLFQELQLLQSWNNDSLCNAYWENERKFFEQMKKREQERLFCYEQTILKDVEELQFWEVEMIEYHCKSWQIKKLKEQFVQDPCLRGNEIEKSKAIFREFLCCIEVNVLKDFSVLFECIKREDHNGLLFQVSFPEDQLWYIVFLDSEEPDEIKKIAWKKLGVERHQVIFLKATKVVRDLDFIFKACVNDDYHTFKNCKWPVLKKYEGESRICANCGIYGHASEQCRKQFCFRCSRYGHIKQKCYAKTNANGEAISD